ncbi:PAS domain S-box protein [Paracraurococcus ruber]|uniref:PAS domain S-box protein n=1 Tax=Paracraurococcus ruber TaxID=77675 RepID=UPI0013051597|nr:PAS domain S-box protein [Paracraurococcus ruber]
MLLLVGAIALPLMAIGAGTLWLNYRGDRARAEAQLLEQARGLARLVDSQFEQAEVVARTLAASPTLARGDLEAFKGELRAARDALSAGVPPGTPPAMLSLLDTEGARLLDTRASDGNGNGLQGLPHALAAAETGLPQVSNLFIGRVTRLPIVAVAVPVFARDDSDTPRVTGAISIALPRTRLLGLVNEAGLPPGSAASVLDRRGTVVARSLRDAETVGKLPMPAVLAAVMERGEGFAPRGTPTLEAVPSTIAFARAPASGYVVKLDIPEAVFVAPLRAALWHNAAVGLAVLGLGLAMAILVARHVVGALRRVPRLATAAAAVAERPAPAGLAEADELAAAIASALIERERATAQTRALFESSPVGVVISDTDGRVHQANDAFLGIVGRTRAELESGAIRWDEITPEEWLARDETAIAEAVARGRCTPYEKEYRRPDGTRVPVLLSFSFIDRAAGTAATFVVDLTQARDAEAARHASEEFAQSILNATSDCVVVLDAEGRVAFMNEPGRCQKELDDVAQAIGCPVEALWPEESRPKVRAALALARSGQVAQYTAFGPTAKGTPRWWDVTVSALPGAAGQPGRLLSVARDVTAARQAAEALRKSEERLRLAQDAGGIGAWEADLVTGTRHWSDSTYRLWGIDPGATITPEYLLCLVHEDDRALMREAVARAKRPEGPFAEVEFRIHRPADGALRWINSRSEAVACDPESGLPVRQVGVMRDITSAKLAEATLARANANLEARVAERTRDLQEAAEELRAEMRRREETQMALAQAQKLEALGQLTGSVAHDFNNVLAAVMGSLRLITRRAADEQVLSLARSGERAAERAATLIRQLMAFARREDLEPVVVSPARVLEEVDQMLRRAVGTGITLTLRAAPDTRHVLTDPHRLEVALLNLAANARDAMDGAGTIQVEARNAVAGSGEERPEELDPALDYVVVAVRDSGPGMPPEVMARAAEPFFTTKPRGQGTGLGLAMVHGFARQSGGALRLTSVPGSGTSAEIWLPRAARDATAPATVEAEPDPALHGAATILVVDDDDQVRLVMATQLRDLGYDVVEASGMASAMALAAATPHFDLVLTDVTMPGGRGPDLALRLRATHPGTPIIFVSGYSDPGALTGEVVMAKPFTAAELSRRVLAALGRLPISA